MIIVRLTGGLGNQMFQYAAARRLANQHNTELKLDISFLEGIQERATRRTYELKHLNVSGNIATSSEVAQITGKGNNLVQTLIVLLRRTIGLSPHQWTVYAERHFHFDPGFLRLPDNTYLDGYWQSEKYFKDIEGIIRNEFILKYPLAGRNREVAEFIQSTNSVSIHVRRGDYVTSQKTAHVHGTCGLDYYNKCIEQLSMRVADPHAIIFSDDPLWVKANIDLPMPTTVIEHNPPGKGYEDLRLMNLCKHNIIANSSFSWWGAWLNNNPEKIVIAPKKWFNDDTKNTNDLIPIQWITI